MLSLLVVKAREATLTSSHLAARRGFTDAVRFSTRIGVACDGDRGWLCPATRVWLVHWAEPDAVILRNPVCLGNRFDVPLEAVAFVLLLLVLLVELDEVVASQVAERA